MGLRYQEDKGLSRAELIKKMHIMLIYNPGVAEYTTSDASLRLLFTRTNAREARRFLIGYNLGYFLSLLGACAIYHHLPY